MLRKTLIMTAVGMGVRYLMRNKPVRDKLIRTLQSFTRGTNQRQM
ncbi:hypothetical protein [Cohnella kolymensis]|nr:hypothetical protein [Cohnella kolymensis]